MAEPQHWPTERMISEGHPNEALPEDLEGLSDEKLAKVAEICLVSTYAPEECIPCLAATMWLDRQNQRLEDMNPPQAEETDFSEYYLGDNDGDTETPKLDALVSEPVVFEQPVRRAPVERLQLQVAMVNETLEEILHGPPIPPKDVSVEELALLAVAADRWVKMTEGQGLELSSNQQAVLDSTKALVARLRS